MFSIFNNDDIIMTANNSVQFNTIY